MRGKLVKLPLYLGMAVFALTILAVALQLGTKGATTQSHINAVGK